MKTAEEIHQIVERIKKNIIGCAGCAIRDLVIDFLKYHNPASREALVELSQYEKNAPAEDLASTYVRYLASEALKSCDQTEGSPNAD